MTFGLQTDGRWLTGRADQLGAVLAAPDEPLAADLLSRLDELTRRWRLGDAGR
jgi:hypothetical protein